jgi:hypothetical protein
MRGGRQVAERSGSGGGPPCCLARVRSGFGVLPRSRPPWTGRSGAFGGLILPKAFERSAGGRHAPMADKHRPARAPGSGGARPARPIVVARMVDRMLDRDISACGGRGGFDPAHERVFGEFCKHRSPPFRVSRLAGERKPIGSGPIGLVHAANRTAIDLDVAGPHRLAWRKRHDIPGATAHFAVVSGGPVEPRSRLCASVALYHTRLGIYRIPHMLFQEAMSTDVSHDK